MYSSRQKKTCKCKWTPRPPFLADRFSYIVTDLMWTNLQHLIARGPVHNDFSKYFCYQMLVRTNSDVPTMKHAITNPFNYSVA